MDNDNTEDISNTAVREYNSNRGDNRRYLGGLFSKADQVEDQMTSDTKKVLDHRDESGSPFIKVAARLHFDGAMSTLEWAKTASQTYRQVAFRSFMNEIEKLGAMKNRK